MDIVNIADLAGFLFLGFGLLDGYRKGLVKKGASLLFTVGSLFLVYLIMWRIFCARSCRHF